jgi:hypothetical protein
MSETELMRVKGSMLLSNSWKQELVITDRAVYGEVRKSAVKRIKMSLPFDRIAQVNIVLGILTANIEVVNKGGADNLIIRAIPKRDAERAKALIEDRINAASTASSSVSIADEIAKLGALRERNLLTEAEFQSEKQKLLAR